MPTLENYFREIDIFDKNNDRKINGMFLSLNDMLNTLIYNDIKHGDLHSGNVLVCLSKYEPMVNLKIIDVDEVRPIQKPAQWDESTQTLEDDMKGQDSEKYGDCGTLGSSIRSDLLNCMQRRIIASNNNKKRARI